jgi:hypothetical protein
VDWTHIIAGILSSFIVAVLGKLLDLQMSKEQREKLDWAVAKGVSLAAERMRGATGGEKQLAAIQQAEALAPKEMRKLSHEQKTAVVDATYARLRPSLPPPSTAFSLREAQLPYSTDVVGSRPPPPKEETP